MFNKRTTFYEAKCRRIGNQQQKNIKIGNMVPGPKYNDMGKYSYEFFRWNMRKSGSAWFYMKFVNTTYLTMVVNKIHIIFIIWNKNKNQ